MIKFFNSNDENSDNVTGLTSEKTPEQLAKEYINSTRNILDRDKYIFSKVARKLFNKQPNNYALLNPNYYDSDYDTISDICSFRKVDMRIFKLMFLNKLKIESNMAQNILVMEIKDEVLTLIERVIEKYYSEKTSNYWSDFDQTLDTCINHYDFMSKNLHHDFNIYTLCEIAQLNHRSKNNLQYFIDDNNDRLRLEIIVMALHNSDVETVKKLYKEYSYEDNELFYFHMKGKTLKVNEKAFDLPHGIIKRFMLNAYKSSRFNYKSYDRGWFDYDRSDNSKDLIDLLLDVKSETVWNSIEDILKNVEHYRKEQIYKLFSVLSHRNIDTSFNQTNIMNLIDLNSQQLNQVQLGLDDDLNTSCYTDLNNSAETMEMVRENLRQQKVNALSDQCKGD